MTSGVASACAITITITLAAHLYHKYEVWHGNEIKQKNDTESKQEKAKTQQKTNQVTKQTNENQTRTKRLRLNEMHAKNET